MNVAVFAACAANLILIGLLPRVFFRADGRFNLMWWLTALPFLVASTALVLAMSGWLPGVPVMSAAWLAAREMTATILAMTSVALIMLTLGTHRQPLALWHQSNDAPVEIVTWGAYARIRHPFYSAFLITLAALLAAVPHVVTLAAFVYGVLILNATAAREERFLAASAFGADYQAYMQRSGRFLPRLSGE